MTDPHLVYDLRVKLDALGHYDDFEVNRVVEVQFDPKAKQGDLVAALTPVVDRLMRRYGFARAMPKTAQDANDGAAAKKSKDELDALMLFQTDMGAFTRLYTFLSHIFDYGNTDIEKRAIFYKLLIPLLDFGSERETIDLSKVRLTHHTVKSLGPQAMPLAGGKYPKREPITEAGSGAVQEKQRAYLNEIIERVNDLFDGELTDQDKLVHVNNVLKGKLLESATLRAQAANNTKEQFANSPDLKSELMGGIIGARRTQRDEFAGVGVRGGERETEGRAVKLQLYESLRQQAP